MSPLLSVVVPFHNVERYIGECLDSISAQSLSDLEVICVDDGSRDGSAAAVVAKVVADPRFRLLTLENGGVGPARNEGAAVATGRYLAFADSDDIVPPRAYERLVSSLEKTGSDFACGNVWRLHGRRLVDSWAHIEAFREPLAATHITRHPELVRDRMTWNKVFRREFWQAHGLSFPPRLYEDQPVVIPAHVLATSVDVLSDVVYHWRNREAGEASITQRSLEWPNLRDRLLSVAETTAFLAEHAPALKPRLDRESLAIDLRVAVRAAPKLSDAELAELYPMFERCLAAVAPADWHAVPAFQRLQLHLLRRRMIPELAEALGYEAGGTARPALLRRGLVRRRWVADHPFRHLPGVPAHASDVTGELALHGRLTGLAWEGDLLCGAGRLSVGRAGGFDLSGLGDARMWIWLRERGGGGELPLLEVTVPHSRVARTDGTGDECGYGFAFAAAPGALFDGGGRRGHWDLHARIALPGLRLETQVSCPVELSADPRPLVRDIWLVPTRNRTGGWSVRVRRAGAVVDRCDVEGEHLVVGGELRRPVGAEVIFDLTRRVGRHAVNATAQVRGRAFTASIPLAELAGAPAVEDRGGELRWDAELVHGRSDRPVVRATARPEWEREGRHHSITVTEDGAMVMVQRPAPEGS